MGDTRREYSLTVTLNKRRFNRVVIDPHLEKKHPDMTDQVILELVKRLDLSESEPVGETDGFAYLAREVCWQDKTYRIVLTYCDEDFLGVVNAFRVKEKTS
jgi:hypothetical protein